MALVLGISAAEIEKVVYFAGYIVTKVARRREEAPPRRARERIQDQDTRPPQNDKEQDALKEKLPRTRSAKSNRIHVGIVLDELRTTATAVKYGAMFEAGIGAEALYDILPQASTSKKL